MWEKWAFIAANVGITCLMRAAIGDIVAAGGADLLPCFSPVRRARGQRRLSAAARFRRANPRDAVAPNLPVDGIDFCHDRATVG
jgi:hypothetical protein